MTYISLSFEVHQPYRLNREFPYQGGDYFNEKLNRSTFNKISEKCYHPATETILDKLDEHKNEFKVTFSISGVFLEQCEMYDPDLLELFKNLAETKNVEFLCQTYYHSLSSLYEDKDDFIAQVKMHSGTIRDLIGYTPTFFENSEFLYNSEIAGLAKSLGFKGIFTEGVSKILGWRSPNYVYEWNNMPVLLRNYQLTDDIGFRFSSRWWEEYPLTADKYAAWLSKTQGDCINIFMDYETLGEHHWADTGIFEFLRYLPDEVLNYDHLSFLTPSKIVETCDLIGEIDVGVFDTISWADLERDTSCWLGNEMQIACYEKLKRLEKKVKGTDDPELLETWRRLGISDHLYYLFTAGGGPGEVHSYFSPYNSPIDAFVIYYSILSDFDRRIDLAK
ncbi:MAG: glycoside hydrolase family 57 protein [Euryarchaeota archaeon]|nr:glycoside hydrolase family 57 protein [Euryarchaeota archaeon]